MYDAAVTVDRQEELFGGWGKGGAAARAEAAGLLKWYEEGLWHLLSFGPGNDQGKSGGLSKSD
jgi:hypothetical protein